MIQHDEGKSRVIYYVKVIGIKAFGDNRQTFIIFDLFNAEQFHKDNIGKRRNTHLPPGFAIIMIFIRHQAPGHRYEQIIFRTNMFGIHVGLLGSAEFKLEECHNRIINHADKFGPDSFIYLALPFFLNTPYPAGLNINLVGNGRCTQYAPGCAVIRHLGHKYIATGRYGIIVLFKRFIRHIINNFVSDFNQETMSFRRDKITPFSGNNSLQCGNNVLSLDNPLVMGILNLTPDSFFDGGRYTGTDACIARTEKMIAEGASIIDLGAVSTRPGAKFITEQEEISRLIPVLELLAGRFPKMVFSVDTYRSGVARLSAAAGAGIINDISGGSMDENLIQAVTETGLPYILMHMQGTPVTMQDNPGYSDVVTEISSYFDEKIRVLAEAGIKQVILDPGFGFGKTIEHNYSLLNHLNIFKKATLPLLVGISRKSMIYKLLNITPEESLPATSALHLASLLNGADILRVHDVKEAVEVIKLAGMLSKAAD